MTFDVSMKYAHLEQERRFLLPGLPSTVGDLPGRRILDRYFDGTRLRLRLMEEVGKPPKRKLGQKVRLEGQQPLAVAHTTVHLDAHEYMLLARLPGAELSKTRRNLIVVGRRIAIDEFHEPLAGLTLAETEHPVICFEQLMAEIGGIAEVTDDDRFSGGRLALTTAEQLRQLLVEHLGSPS